MRATRRSERVNTTASLFATPAGPSSWPAASSSSNLLPSHLRRWADAPRPSRERHVGVGHHQPPVASVLHPLHPRVLKALRSPGACLGKDVAVLVVVPAGGGEDHDVGDVVEKTRPGAVTGGCSRPARPGRTGVVGTGVMQDTGVEQRPVASTAPASTMGGSRNRPDRTPLESRSPSCRARSLLRGSMGW